MNDDFINKAEKKIEQISENLEIALEQKKHTEAKINQMEKDIIQMKNYIQRPNIAEKYNDELEYKSSLERYVRTGTKGDFISKSLDGSEGNGGVLIRSEMYDKIQQSIKCRSIMRSLAKIIKISTNSFDVISQDGNFVGHWVNSTDERVVTETPKLFRKEVKLCEMSAQPMITQNMLDDSSINIIDWVNESIVSVFADMENKAFIYGTGKDQPFGIINAANQNNTIVSDLTPEFLHDMINLLDNNYRANAVFIMNRRTLSLIQNLKDVQGRYIYQMSLTERMKETIFGFPVVCFEEMPDIQQKNEVSIIFGDIKSAYMVLDRDYMHLIHDQYTNKPYVKIYVTKRVGGDVINDKALMFAKIVENKEERM